MSLLNHSTSLWKFIHSNRYNADPTEIASAMVGAPMNVGPRTSLDYFLAKKNSGTFLTIPFGAEQERMKRISSSKNRAKVKN